MLDYLFSKIGISNNFIKTPKTHLLIFFVNDSKAFQDDFDNPVDLVDIVFVEHFVTVQYYVKGHYRFQA